VLVDSQFGPRRIAAVNKDDYRESVRWSARRFERRFFSATTRCKFTVVNGVFDLDAEDKASKTSTADASTIASRP